MFCVELLLEKIENNYKHCDPSVTIFYFVLFYFIYILFILFYIFDLLGVFIRVEKLVDLPPNQKFMVSPFLILTQCKITESNLLHTLQGLHLLAKCYTLQEHHHDGIAVPGSCNHSQSCIAFGHLVHLFVDCHSRQLLVAYLVRRRIHPVVLVDADLACFRTSLEY